MEKQDVKLDGEQMKVLIKGIFERLKGFDAEALAFELASMVAGIDEALIDNLIKGIKANSEIAKKNRKVKLRNKQCDRLKVLMAKKKLSADEKVEVHRLMKILKPFLTE